MNSLLSTGLQYLDRVTYKLEKKTHHIYEVCKKNTDTAFVSPSKLVLILQYGIS